MQDPHSMEFNPQIQLISGFLPEAFRVFIEENYYAKINQQLALENIVHDPTFLEDPLNHVALFTDHGIVHVRNVAQLVVQVLEVVNGTQIPYRSPERLERMKGCGVLLAYVHDIGMVDCSSFGRAVHAAFMMHEIFSPVFDDMIELIWDRNVSNIPWRLINLIYKEGHPQPPLQILRELLALAFCHSKSSLPIDILNDRKLLREALQNALESSLDQIFYIRQIEKLKKKIARSEIAPEKGEEKLKQLEVSLQQAIAQEEETRERRKKIALYYQNFRAESFQWLISDEPVMKEWVDDVIDTIRALRSADALRQRGTALKTSGNYQVFINQFTADSVVALTKEDGQVFFLEGDNPFGSAEANLASANFTPRGNLLFTFFRGSFGSKQALDSAVKSMAMLIRDIQADVVESFRRGPQQVEGKDSLKHKERILLLEETKDNYEFTELLAQEIMKTEPKLKNSIKLVPPLHSASERERDYYLKGSEVGWTAKRKKAFLAKMAKTGQKVEHIDLERAFDQTRIITLDKGQTLMRADESAEFVYIPFANGLVGFPQGGYSGFKVLAATPLGATGVIRGDIRNATVIVERKMKLLMIPQYVYLKYWYKTYTADEFVSLMKEIFKLK